MQNASRSLPVRAVITLDFVSNIRTEAARPARGSSSHTGSSIPGIAGTSVAWDSSRKDWRTFRVDRIEGKLKTSMRFKPRKAAGRRFRSLRREVVVAGAVSVPCACDLDTLQSKLWPNESLHGPACSSQSTIVLACFTPVRIPWKRLRSICHFWELTSRSTNRPNFSNTSDSWASGLNGRSTMSAKHSQNPRAPENRLTLVTRTENCAALS